MYHDSNTSTSSGPYTEAQLRRAAWLLWRTLEVKQRIERNDLFPPSRAGKEHWAKRSSLLAFHTTRIPQIGCDTFAAYPKSSDNVTHPGSDSIILLVNGQQILVKVFEAGETLCSPAAILSRLRAAVKIATRSREKSVDISSLTGANRDDWAMVRILLEFLFPGILNRKTEPSTLDNGIATKHS